MTDVDGIGSVNSRAWRSRYAGLLTDEALQALDPADLTLTWASAILNPPTPAHRLLVAVDDDDVVGYAALGPSQDPDADATTVELFAWEVDPDRTRQGHGSRLMAAAIDHARGLGMTSAMVWCPLSDESRRAFLQSAGWGPDSAYRDLLVGEGADGSEVTVREVRLITAIDG